MLFHGFRTRYASAQRTRHLTNTVGWERNIRVASSRPLANPNLVEQASEILGVRFSTQTHLLTHATIVASVDTYDVPGAKTGNVLDGYMKINRKYSDYRVKPDCDRWINNNHDGWERKLLLKSYPTFIGAHNYVEHIQDPAQSKGRIIDAVARDVGDSVYIDILIATDRRHQELIHAINTGQLNTLSMGCTIDFSVCTQCGNVAVDERDMCLHVKHEKGQRFRDALGRTHRIAELCGHHTAGDGGGVRFIEASWVAVPAFGGAILQNILSPEELTPDQLRRAFDIVSNPPPIFDQNAYQGFVKAASLLHAAHQMHVSTFDFGDDDEGGGEGEGGDLGSFVDQVSDKVKEESLKRVKREIEDEINPPENTGEAPSTAESATAIDESLNKGASLDVRRLYMSNLRLLVKTASKPEQLINNVATLNSMYGIRVPVSVYRTALRVGSIKQFQNHGHYLRACQKHLGQPLTQRDQISLIRLGQLLARHQH